MKLTQPLTKDNITKYTSYRDSNCRCATNWCDYLTKDKSRDEYTNLVKALKAFLKVPCIIDWNDNLINSEQYIADRLNVFFKEQGYL